MFFAHDTIASAGYIGLGFTGVASGILAYILAALILFLAVLGVIELFRIPVDLHRRKIKKAEKARQKQLARELKAAEKARKKGEPSVPPAPPELPHEPEQSE